MATVNVFNAEKSQLIEDQLIVDAEIIDGHLILHKMDAPDIDAGVIVSVQPINAQTGTTYTINTTDERNLVTLDNASPITVTLPQDSDMTYGIGIYTDLMQLGAGQVTVVAGTGATLKKSGLTAKSRAQDSRFGIQKIAANTWSLFGDLATA